MKLTFINPTVVNAVDVEDTAASIVENLNRPELSFPERYAIANRLKKASEMAAAQLSDDAINYALRPSTEEDPNDCQPMASNGKEFYHRGFAYCVIPYEDYNYDQNDEHGREWKEAVNNIAKYKRLASAYTEVKNSLQPIILEEHPLLRPTTTVLVFKFNSTKKENG